MTDEIAVMVCGHGSRDPEAITEFEAIAEHLRAHGIERMFFVDRDPHG